MGKASVILLLLVSCGKAQEPKYTCNEYYDPVNNTYTDEELELIRYNYQCEFKE